MRSPETETTTPTGYTFYKAALMPTTHFLGSTPISTLSSRPISMHGPSMVPSSTSLQVAVGFILYSLAKPQTLFGPNAPILLP